MTRGNPTKVQSYEMTLGCFSAKFMCKLIELEEGDQISVPRSKTHPW